MSYRCSRARREFENQLMSAVAELTPMYKLAQKKGGGSRVLGAYFIFAYSQLEVYIKTLVEDAIKTLNHLSPTFEKWPDLMLGYVLHKGENLAADYRRYGNDDNEGEIIKKLSIAARKVASWKEGAASVEFNAADFLEKKKYPSPKNFPQLFRRLGINKIWAVVDKAGRMNGQLVLQSLNDLRTQIAHEGIVPPGFNLADFRSRVKQMRHFVAAVDRSLSSHFCSSVVSSSGWNEAMSS